MASVAAFLRSVKMRAMLPDTQGLFTDEDIGEVADEELRSLVVPLVMRLRQEFLVQASTVAITGDTVPLPAFSIAGRLRDVVWTPVGGRAQSLPQHAADDVREHVLPGFYLQDMNLVLTGGIASGALRLTYFAEPPSTDFTVLNDPYVTGLPDACTPLLAQAVACRLLEAQAMTEELKVARERLAELSQGLTVLLTPRVEGEAKRFVNRHLLGV